MNCSPSMAIALLLLSLTSGTLLLYKTQKENLGVFFKVVAWFVVLVSFCAIICCTVHCLMRSCVMKQECHEMRMGECGSDGDHDGMRECHMERIMMRGDGEECPMMGKGCCKEKMECMEGKTECAEGEKKCCDKDKKCDPDSHREKKDSVVIIKRK